MNLTFKDVAADLAVIGAAGDEVSRIEMGQTAADALNRCRVEANERARNDSSVGLILPLTAGRLFGHDFRVIESLGESINYLLVPHPHDPPWVSHGSLYTEDMMRKGIAP